MHLGWVKIVMAEFLQDCWTQQDKDFEARWLEDAQTNRKKFSMMPFVKKSMDLYRSFWNDHETTITFLSKVFLDSKPVLMQVLGVVYL